MILFRIRKFTISDISSSGSCPDAKDGELLVSAIIELVTSTLGILVPLCHVAVLTATDISNKHFATLKLTAHE
jgi:hypothetical protein